MTEIYTAMQQENHLQSTLFVLCGDHGMNEAGNHGGSSAGETSPALLFISPKFESLGRRESPIEPSGDMQYYQTVQQADIAPTLAGLLGLPIPLNSLGVFIPDFLEIWDHGMPFRFGSDEGKEKQELIWRQVMINSKFYLRMQNSCSTH